MYCTKCGQMFEDNASFCPFCGERVIPEGAPNAASFDSVSAASPFDGANPYDAPQPGVQSAGYSQAQGGLTKPYLIPNILGTILCCSPIFITGLVFSILANNKARVGDVRDANSKAQIAMILFWVGVGLGILQTILLGIFMALGAAGSLQEVDARQENIPTSAIVDAVVDEQEGDPRDPSWIFSEKTGTNESGARSFFTVNFI